MPAVGDRDIIAGFIRLSRKTPPFRARMQSEGGIAAPLPFVG